MTLESQLSNQLAYSLSSLPKPVNRLVLAFSGGLDSSVLLHLLKQQTATFQVLIWHVNHGLLESAEKMESFCQQVTQSYGFEFRVSHLHLNSAGSNLEARARKARYAVFEQALSNQDCLLTAHHADDQAETFFLNLLRGSGSAGLRGIARQKALSDSHVLRPLLDFSRAELEQYAQEKALPWVDDPSNLEDRFNRNYLRNRVLPLLRSRWPGYLESIRSVCAIQVETRQLLDEVAQMDFQQCKLDTELCRKQVLTLSLARQKNLIRCWLLEQGYNNLAQGKLNELLRQLSASEAANPVVSGCNYAIRVYQNRLYIVPEGASGPILTGYLLTDAHIHIEAIGLAMCREDVFEQFNLDDQGQEVAVRFRSAQPTLKAYKHRLKNLFQKHRIPPWKRELTPQIYINDELIGLWLKP
ncbi:MAG: tRNA lysidine(34) synthetase TilS [Gammaproteobacteria bacterium]|nr:tRNA lysidine(34) synthetase TilS [Gammaproteobacteria bacterium]